MLHFSDDEFARRRSLLESELERRELDGMLLFFAGKPLLAHRFRQLWVLLLPVPGCWGASMYC